MMSWLRRQDRNELSYWMGLLMLFVGLSLGVSIATALWIVGAVMVVESVTTSYIASWISEKKI